MKTLQQWYDEYAISHQHEVNKKIHLVCVPAIYFSIVGLIICIPNEILTHQVGLTHPLLGNWAIVALIPVLLFYLSLSFKVFLKMFWFSVFAVLGNYLIGKYLRLLPVSVLIFALAWIGQFYGHKIEGKKPSFLKDLQFLLIGPAWVFEKIQNHE